MKGHVMDTHELQSAGHERAPETPAPALPDLSALHEQARNFLSAAERALHDTMSRDSQAFLEAIPQQSGQ
jgi:hypothetical protein